MARSALATTDLDPGFARDGVVTVEVALNPSEETEFWRLARPVISATPGVEADALGLFVHLGGRADQWRVGPASGEGDEWPIGAVNYSVVESDLFSLLDIVVEEGRVFSRDLAPGEELEVVINAAMATRLWPQESAVGTRLRIETPSGDLETATVVGVVETVKTRRLNEDPTPFFYLPLSQWERDDLVLHLRVDGSQSDVIASLRSRLEQVDSRAAITVRRMDDHATVAFALGQVLARVLIGSAIVALLIATAGIIGTVAHSVQGRIPELAVRMAVGASTGQVERMVLLETLRVVAAGVVIGLSVAWFLGPALGPFLYGVSPRDVGALASVILTLTVVALGAAMWPTQRVTRNLSLRDTLSP